MPEQRIPDAFGRTLEEVPLTARGGGSRRRAAVPGADEATPAWFEVSRAAGPGGEALGFALDAGEIVAAEASLRRFVETLTETFAHLPIGLAVFDKNRRLGLFNPALTELVKIDAVWLAGRPSLRDFLERLRETRQMPEQKDFASWRRKLGELEEGARDGTYEENWVLPSGKVFRVTGRPHPQGALAFLFEDISTAIMLERRYRCELELSQATLDRLSEAVAVFDASGMLAFVNSAFERLWQLDPMARLEGPGIAGMTALWAERCGPSPVWPRIAEFATAGGARNAWSDEVATIDGRRISVLVAPLPDASALVVFREGVAAPPAEGTADGAGLALTRLAGAADGALRRDGEAAAAADARARATDGVRRRA
jgi:PAS domain-containing protein